MQKLFIYWFLLLISSSAFSIDVTKYDKIYNYFKDSSFNSLNSFGESYYKRGSLDSALVCFSIISGSYTADSKKLDDQIYAHAYNRCGAIYIQFNSYTKALNMFLKALEVCEYSDNENYTPKIYNNIASIYYLFHDYRTAESYCEKAYAIGLKYDDKEIQKTLLNNMIGINCYQQEYSKAKKHLSLLKLLQPEKQSTLNYYLCISNGALDLEQHKHKEALYWFKKSVLFTNCSSNPDRLKYVAFSNISKVYQYGLQYDSALVYLKRGEAIAIENKYDDLRFECYNDFSEIYRKSGNEKLSLFYKRKNLELADSIFSTKEFGQIKDLQFLHEMDKIEKQVYRLTDSQILKDNQIHFQQKILQTIICAFAIIVALLIIMYLQNRKLREANVELFNKNLEIIKSEENEKKKRKQTAGNNVNISLLDKRMSEDSEGIDNQMIEAVNSKMKYLNSVINEDEKKRMREAIEEVMDNTLEFCSVDFNLDKLAALINSKSKYVSQVINESYGKNFNVFVNEYRIKEARRRLMDTRTYGNFTIAYIATDVGFKSNANFNLVFKKVTGITPSVYQMMAKKRVQKIEESDQITPHERL